MISNVATNEVLSSLDLNLVITDQNVLTYLSEFKGEDLQVEKAMEAFRVGVIAIQSASPMSRLQKMLSESFEKINRALGHIDGQELEARRLQRLSV